MGRAARQVEAAARDVRRAVQVHVRGEDGVRGLRHGRERAGLLLRLGAARDGGGDPRADGGGRRALTIETAIMPCHCILFYSHFKSEFSAIFLRIDWAHIVSCANIVK